MLLTIQVLNDLGIIILDTSNHGQPRAICFGGATAALSCHVSLAANQELLIFPVSFRSWPGPVSLGWYRCAVTSGKMQTESCGKKLSNSSWFLEWTHPRGSSVFWTVVRGRGTWE